MPVSCHWEIWLLVFRDAIQGVNYQNFTYKKWMFFSFLEQEGDPCSCSERLPQTRPVFFPSLFLTFLVSITSHGLSVLFICGVMVAQAFFQVQFFPELVFFFSSSNFFLWFGFPYFGKMLVWTALAVNLVAKGKQWSILQDSCWSYCNVDASWL